MVIPHNFSIQVNGVDQTTPILKPGETASLTIDLQPRTYTYKCTVHFHHLLGMKGILTVLDSESLSHEKKYGPPDSQASAS